MVHVYDRSRIAPPPRERFFERMPALGARVYDWLAGRPRTIDIQLRQIASDLTSRIERGRLLEVGIGHGRLLREIHRINAAIDLYGLDISPAMVQRARINLKGVPVDLRAGNIRYTNYASEFFDLVTCTGSLYLWDDPSAGLCEIHRVLVEGGTAHLFEPDADATSAERREMRRALRRESPFRRLIGPVFIRIALKVGVRVQEMIRLLDQTPFSGSYSIERATLADVPVWLRITLRKTD